MSSKTNIYSDAYVALVESYEQAEAIFHSASATSEEILDHLYKCKTNLLRVITTEDDHSYFIPISELKDQLETQIKHVESSILNRDLQSQFSFASQPIDFPAAYSRDDFYPNSSLQGNTPVVSSNIDPEKYEMISSMKVSPMVQGFDDVAGMKELKSVLRTLLILPIYQPQLYENRKRTNSILLFGPPGTGKTRFVHGLAAEAKITLYSISAGDILGKYVGQTEKMIREIFNFARDSEDNLMLFIDEVDGLCQKRTDDEKQYVRRLKTELMCQLTNFENYKNAFLICATNCPWDIDTAFIRRFQKRIHVPLPNRSERHEIIAYYTKNTGLENTDIFWDTIIDRTDGYSSSDIANLITHALNTPIFELEDVKVWRVVDDKFYKPVGKDQFSDKIICCSVNELPPNSIVARDVEFLDLFNALQHVKKTVSENTVEKYKNYIKIS